MAEGNRVIKVIILVLIGSCILNLIFAFNAGQKRRDAVSRLDSLNAKLSEIELRYKNAVRSYDELKKDLDEAKKGLDEERRFSATLKETLEAEKKKAQALEDALNKAKVIEAKPQPAAKNGTQAQSNGKKKADRTTKNW
jgi:predicted nuclease with TOPRIM domain